MRMACRSTGCFRIYSSQASDDHRPMARMVDELAPLTASAVAPPALMEWPLMLSAGMILWRRRENQPRVGIEPLLRSQSSRWHGKRRSREATYFRKAARGSGPRPMVFFTITSASSKTYPTCGAARRIWRDWFAWTQMCDATPCGMIATRDGPAVRGPLVGAGNGSRQAEARGKACHRVVDGESVVAASSS